MKLLSAIDGVGMKAQKLILLILFCLINPLSASGDKCWDCSRRGYVKLVGPSHEELIWSEVTTRLGEVLTTDCFRMAPGADVCEYRFEVSFRTDLSGEVDEEGNPVKSCLTIKLFHDETGELVKTWKTEAHNNNLGFHYRRMFKNADAVLKRDRPIEPYLWELEKRPARAEIKLEHEDVFANEMVMLEIRNIFDEEGIQSREFNRIIVCPDKGRIDAKLLKNGAQWEMDAKCGVFRIGKGPLFVPYTAPPVNRCQGDLEQIIVYNSCDILHPDKLPLAKTRSRDEIGVKHFGLICLKPKKLRMKYKMHMLHTWRDSSQETNVRATVDLALGEPKTWRNTSSGYPKTEVPLKSIKVVDFFAKIVRTDKNGRETLTGSNPQYGPDANWTLDKIPAQLYHDKDNYKKMKLFYIHPIYYNFTWSDGNQGSLGYYFLEQSHDPVIPGLKTQNSWLDQLVTEGDGYYEYGGKGYALEQKPWVKTENWFEWSFTR
jgi:hypothetical protein